MEKLKNYWVRLSALITLLTVAFIIGVVSAFIALTLLPITPFLAIFTSSIGLPKTFDGLFYEFD